MTIGAGVAASGAVCGTSGCAAVSMALAAARASPAIVRVFRRKKSVKVKSLLHFARSSQRLRSYKDMGDKWDLIKVHLYRIGYSGVVESAILANQRHHAKCLLKENVHD